MGGLTFDHAGNLYGTTASGGIYNSGTVFRLVRSHGRWIETVIHNFSGGRDGAMPTGDVVVESNGVLYGTTSAGGTKLQNGTVYKLAPSRIGWKETILHRFNGSDGYSPMGGVILDKKGVLYATTYAGGTYNAGTVFKLERSKDKWELETLYNFAGSSDGGFPVSTLLMDHSGSLYGTTLWDGDGWGWNCGDGVVFEILR